MENKLAIELLLKKRTELKGEMDEIVAKLSGQISSIEASIEELSGKTVWETAADYRYDDENPDYIKGSIEG